MAAKRKWAPRAGGLLPRMSPETNEEPIHRSIVSWLEICVPPPPDGPLWFHPYNGGYRTAADAGIGRALGVLAGVADLVFLWRPSFCIEIKSRSGTLSKPQERVARDLLSLGLHTHVARSIEDVTDALRQENVPFKESKIW